MYESEHTAKYVGRHMHACMHVGIAYACMCYKYHMCQKYCITEGAELGLTDVLPATKHLAYHQCFA